MRDIPKPGQIYRHFKGHLYQIVTIARHSETMEALVIYQALYGDFQVYARPLHMGMSELDKEKYSDVKQRDRFELVQTIMEDVTPVTVQEVGQAAVQEAAQAMVQAEGAGEAILADIQPQLDSGVEEFLEADSYEQRLRIFTGMQHRLNDDMINIMAVSMDTEVPEGQLDDRIASLKNFLLMQVKFECNRILRG